MIDITIPETFAAETSYTFSCLFREFLGVDCSFEFKKGETDYVISGLEKKLIIKNHFFIGPFRDSIYCMENIPKGSSSTKINIGNKAYPCTSIFGSDKIVNDDSKLTIDLDIIASTFFMLTRWEEAIVKQRDIHNRFPVQQSLAFKHRFLDRPIVNEYVEIIWALLVQCGIKQKRKKRSFKIIPTHDVDIPFKWWNAFQFFHKQASTLKRLEFREFSINLSHFLNRKDPFDTFDLLMSKAEKINQNAHFFFMAGGKTKYDNRYDIKHPRILRLIKKIQKRGHRIGIHPSYDTCDNPLLFKHETQRLSEACGQNITFGRHHYLRFSIPQTWNIWADNDMIWDSTLGYAGRSGFRCGVCYDFPVFDFAKRKQLTLREKPLIVMEVSLLGYEKLSLDESVQRIQSLKNTVKRYNGDFVFLWHNSSVNQEGWYNGLEILDAFYQ